MCGALLLFQSKQNVSTHFVEKLTGDELDLINAYKLHFSYPGTTRELSATLAAINIIALGFIPLLLWKEHYVETVIVGLNWPLVGILSHKLSPLNGLKGMAARGNTVAMRKLAAWDSAWQKIVVTKP